MTDTKEATNWPRVYVGPTIYRLNLIYGQVFINQLPPAVESGDMQELKPLFVRLPKFRQASDEARHPNTRLNMIYKKFINY